MTVALILVNYNMPERTNALVTHLRKHTLHPLDYYVVDNGSDIKAPSLYTTVKLVRNVQTTGGWLAGLQAARDSGERYLAYWFIITSAEIAPDSGDILTPMAEWLATHTDAVGIHPALTADSTTHWTHLHTRGGDQPRQTWFIDNIASLYRADWFDEIGWFDPRLRYAWGIDLETCWLARKQNRTLWVDERVRIKKVTDIGYQLQRMNMTAHERRALATQNMQEVQTEKYGYNWHSMMLTDRVTEDMR